MYVFVILRVKYYCFFFLIFKYKWLKIDFWIIRFCVSLYELVISICNFLSGIIVCVFKMVFLINVFGCLNGLDMEIIIELLCIFRGF